MFVSVLQAYGLMRGVLPASERHGAWVQDWAPLVKNPLSAAAAAATRERWAERRAVMLPCTPTERAAGEEWEDEVRSALAITCCQLEPSTLAISCRISASHALCIDGY